MAQVGSDWHSLQFGFAVLNAECGFVKAYIQRHCGACLALGQGVALHHLVWQHGDFVARHVHRGQTIATYVVDGAAGFNGQTWGRNVNAHHHLACAQTLQRQRVVDFCGL